MLTLGTIGTVDSKLQIEEYTWKWQWNIKELLKSFKEFGSYGFENCHNLHHCKINTHGLRETEIKFEDSQVTVALGVSRQASLLWLKDQGFFHPVFHHLSESSSRSSASIWENRKKKIWRVPWGNLEAISDTAVHNLCSSFADQHSLIWPTDSKGLENGG